jgi:hypothetical protein
MRGSWLSRRDQVAVEVLKVLGPLGGLSEEGLVDKTVRITDALLAHLDGPVQGDGESLVSEFDDVSPGMSQQEVTDRVLGNTVVEVSEWA